MGHNNGILVFLLNGTIYLSAAGRRSFPLPLQHPAQVTWARSPSEMCCCGPTGDSETAMERIKGKFQHRCCGYTWKSGCWAERSSAGFQSLHRKCWKHLRLWGQILWHVLQAAVRVGLANYSADFLVQTQQVGHIFGRQHLAEEV